MSLLETTIGLLAPTVCLGCGREGAVLCELCAAAEIVPYSDHCWRCGAVSSGGRTCPRCRHLGGPRHVWINTLYEGVAARLIRAYKYSHLRAAAPSLARLMAETFAEHQLTAAAHYLLVPVPTATSRRRARGFDHAELLARELSRRLAQPVGSAVGRLGQARQVGAPRTQRLAQPHGQYYLRRPESVVGRNVLLVDDVITTGATLAEVARLLRRAGARRVDALVFAKRL